LRTLRGIDAHTFPSTAAYVNGFLGAHKANLEAVWGATFPVRTEEEWADEYREQGLLGLVMSLDAERATGHPKLSNEYVADVVAKHGDVFIAGFGAVEAWSGKHAIREARHCVEDLGLIGITFEQQLQEFYPNDRTFYPLWEAIQKLDVPVLFHTGSHGYGVGLPGGGGSRLKYCKPIPYIDDLAADFPNLRIISTHPAWPWQDEAIAMGIHKGNVFFDLAGYLPKHLPEALKHDMARRLQNKVMMATDHPSMSPGRWLQSFFELGLKREVEEKILWKNAIEIYRLHDRIPADVVFNLDSE
jgi:predicted TIM-barrel fold metal-dependent hydrolase